MQSSAGRFAFKVFTIASLCAGPALAQDTDQDGVSDAADVYPCDPTLAGASYSPAQGAAGLLLIEDQFPGRGDYDFNDATIGYHYVFRIAPDGGVASVLATFDVVALGALYDNGLGLVLPVPTAQVASVTRSIGGGAPQSLVPAPGAPDLTVRVSGDLRELFNGAPGPLNVTIGEASTTPPLLSVEITFSTPLALPTTEAPFDVFLFRASDPTLEIHRPPYAGTASFDASRFNTGDDASSPGRYFVDTAGVPFVLTIPEAVPHTGEALSIDALYPDIVAFGASGGAANTDFYRTNRNTSFAYSDNTGAHARAARAGSDVIDNSCVLTCPLGSSDCDGNVSNGCEQLASDDNHCGACGNVCASGQQCLNGTCQVPSCNNVFTPTPPGPNCSDITGLRTSQSSTGNYRGQGANHALDGLACTAWNGATYSGTVNIFYDEDVPMSGLTLLYNASPATVNTRFYIETRADGGSWVVQHDVQRSMTSNQEYVYPFAQTVNARDVRVRIVSSGSWASWREIRVFSCGS